METTADMIFQFDELIRCYNVLMDSTCEKEFLRFASNQELLRLKWVETTNECKRLKDKLDAATKDISVLDGKLNSARRWLDAERQQRKKVELERDAFINQLEEMRRILLTDPRSKISDETKQKLSFLNGGAYEFNGNRHQIGSDHLNTIIESDSASLVSDISFSRSDNDLDEIHKSRTEKKKHHLPFEDDEPGTIKKRKSIQPSRYFTPTAPRVESIESGESDDIHVELKDSPREKKCVYSAMDQISQKSHVFVSKTLMIPESCLWCQKKIKFGRMFLKCVDCHAIAHMECRDTVPVPCAPTGTPSKKIGIGATISDYAPAVPPMIPAVVILCINEVERRGLSEVGIYRISGTEAVVRGLREKFLKHKGMLNLAQVDIHSVCSCLKDFLRNLQDPLIPRAQWKTFAEAIEASDKQSKLLEAVSTLPQANCDTLAFLVLHLQNVASSPECKMSVSNLAAVFGPTIVGYSSEEQTNALAEIHTSNAIMEALLSLPKDYWNHFIAKPSASCQTPVTIRSTPSTESLTRKTPLKFLTTPGGKKKFFNYSPSLDK